MSEKEELEPASVHALVRPSTLSNINISKSSRPIAIKSEASLGWGKGCVMFWARSERNSGFNGNR